MNLRTKVAFCVAVALFGIGDLITTYQLFVLGGVESNVFLSGFSFSGIVAIKALFLVLCYGVLIKLEDYAFESGIVLGSVIAVGLVTTFSNLGVYSGGI